MIQSAANTARIQARWREQEKENTIQGLWADVPAIPLTSYHICPQELPSVVSSSFSPPVDAANGSGSFEIWVDGALMKVKAPKRSVKAGKTSPHLRGLVNGFSGGARRRLMRKIAMLRSDARPLFVTLTYPMEFTRDWREWKNDLHKFARRFGRMYPQGAFVWRLEPQRRGAPHFHLLVYGVEMSGDTVRWLQGAWYGSVNSEDKKHYTWGVHVEPVRSARGVRSYVGKYIAKKQDIPDSQEAISQEPGSTPVDWVHVGRWWGIRFGGNLPESERFAASGLDSSSAAKLLRAMRHYLRSQGFRVSSNLPALTMFVNSPQSWANSIDGLMGGVYVGTGSFNSLEKRLQ